MNSRTLSITNPVFTIHYSNFNIVREVILTPYRFLSFPSQSPRIDPPESSRSLFLASMLQHFVLVSLPFVCWLTNRLSFRWFPFTCLPWTSTVDPEGCSCCQRLCSRCHLHILIFVVYGEKLRLRTGISGNLVYRLFVVTSTFCVACVASARIEAEWYARQRFYTARQYSFTYGTRTERVLETAGKPFPSADSRS